MLRRFLLFPSVLLTLLALIVAMPALAQEDQGCSASSYRESIEILGEYCVERDGLSCISPPINFTVTAEKIVVGDYREANLYVAAGDFQSTPSFSASTGGMVALPEEDDDWLEVSCDLGWAGLDTTVQVYDQSSGQYYPLEIHLSLYGNNPVWLRNDDTEFVRDALIFGTVTIPGNPELYSFTFDGNPTTETVQTGFIISTQHAYTPE